MKRRYFSFLIAALVGLAPIAGYANCGHEHGAKSGHSAKHGHKCDGTCPHHKHKNHEDKKAEGCTGDGHCVTPEEKQTNLNSTLPSKDVSLLPITDETNAFAIVAFLEPTKNFPEPIVSAVPIYLLKKSLRP